VGLHRGAERLQHRVLHGGQQPQWGKSLLSPGNLSTDLNLQKIMFMEHDSSNCCFLDLAPTALACFMYKQPSYVLSLDVRVHFCDCRKRLCDSPPEDPNYQPLPEERPGGFNWGEAGRRLANDENAPDGDL